MQKIKLYFKDSDEPLVIEDKQDAYDEDKLTWFLNHGDQMEALGEYIINKARVVKHEIEKVD